MVSMKHAGLGAGALNKQQVKDTSWALTEGVAAEPWTLQARGSSWQASELRQVHCAEENIIKRVRHGA